MCSTVVEEQNFQGTRNDPLERLWSEILVRVMCACNSCFQPTTSIKTPNTTLFMYCLLCLLNDTRKERLVHRETGLLCVRLSAGLNSLPLRPSSGGKCCHFGQFHFSELNRMVDIYYVIFDFLSVSVFCLFICPAFAKFLVLIVFRAVAGSPKICSTLRGAGTNLGAVRSVHGYIPLRATWKRESRAN